MRTARRPGGTFKEMNVTEADTARDVFTTGVKNAHAMENQALSIMRPQLERLEHYPDMARRLEQHIAETEGQIGRLDQILDRVDESASSLKDSFLSTFGSMASLGHAAAGDEVLKNAMANHAFENYEIAAYLSLIASAEASGRADVVPLLEQNLGEEREMAEWIARNIPTVTQASISLSASGERANR